MRRVLRTLCGNSFLFVLLVTTLTIFYFLFCCCSSCLLFIFVLLLLLFLSFGFGSCFRFSFFLLFLIFPGFSSAFFCAFSSSALAFASAWTPVRQLSPSFITSNDLLDHSHSIALVIHQLDYFYSRRPKFKHCVSNIFDFAIGLHTLRFG